LVQSNPITGVGVGMNALAMNAARGETWRMVHNVYLQYAVDLGLPGLILFLVLMVRCIRKAGAAGRAAARLRDDGGLAPLAAAVPAFFHPVGYGFYFYYMAGLAVGLETAVDSLSGVSGRPGGSRA